MATLSGIFPAVVTPFRNGAFDDAAFSAYLRWLLDAGVHGLVPCGTTGEAATLTIDEYAQVVRATVRAADGTVPVIAGAGSNDTAHAIELSRVAAACGASALLQVTPYYNKPTPAGLLAHYRAIAAATDLPIILYNVPGRTGCNMSPAVVAELAQIPTIVGLKDASGSLVQATDHLRTSPTNFGLYCGDDMINFPLYALGYHGAISVTANVRPHECVAQWNAWVAGDVVTAQRLHRELHAITLALFLESNPIPVKTVLAAMGKCAEEWRLPLTPPAPDNKARILAALRG